MDTVILDGVEYVKASTIAKRFRYTADYVGQLCRGKKIDARLVGRTWFVNPESLEAHKRTRHQRPTDIQATEEEARSVAVKLAPERPLITPRLKKATLHHLAQSGGAVRPTERHLRVAYEPDDENILPTLHKKEIMAPRTVHIEHVDAKRISIKGRQAPVLFVAEELPEVALEGKLTVTDYPEEATAVTEEQVKSAVADTEGDVRNDFKNKVISDKRETDAKAIKQPGMAGAVKVRVRDTASRPERQRSAPVEPEQSLASKQKSKRLTIVADTNEVREERPVFFSTNAPEAAAPGAVPSSFTPESVARLAPTQKRVSTVVLLSPLIATLAAATFVLLILLASNVVIVSDTGYESKVVLQVANLLQLLQQ